MASEAIRLEKSKDGEADKVGVTFTQSGKVARIRITAKSADVLGRALIDMAKAECQLGTVRSFG